MSFITKKRVIKRLKFGELSYKNQSVMKIPSLIIIGLCYTHFISSQTIIDNAIKDSIIVNPQITISEQENVGPVETKPSAIVQTDSSEIIDITKKDNIPNGVIINQLNVIPEANSQNTEL